MKKESEQHGKELNTEYVRDGINYHDLRELAPQRGTFTEPSPNSDGVTGSNGAMKDNREWPTEPPAVGDGQLFVTPISKTPLEPTPHKHNQYTPYLDGKNFDPPTQRVPDAGKKWEVSSGQGEGVGPVNQGPQTPANLRPIKLGWKDRGYDLSDGTWAGAPATKKAGSVGNTPQRSKQRRKESK